MRNNETLVQYKRQGTGSTSETQRILDVIVHRMVTNMYPIGSRMPTCRALAREMNVNHNTVGRVYQQMAKRGLLLCQVGRGTFVLRSPHEDAAADLRTRFLTGIREGLVRAKRDGLSCQDALDLLKEALDTVYSHNRSIAFVECLPADTRQVAEFLSRAMHVNVDPIVLGDLLDSPDIASHYAFVTTTFYHLSEVTEALNGTGIEVIGLQHEPSSETLLRVARLPRGSVVAVIAPNERTIERLTSLVSAYGLKPTIASAPEQITREMLREAGITAVIDIRSSHSQAVVKYRNLPCITVDFAISPQSMEYLRQRCAESEVSAAAGFGGGGYGHANDPAGVTTSGPNPGDRRSGRTANHSGRNHS